MTKISHFLACFLMTVGFLCVSENGFATHRKPPETRNPNWIPNPDWVPGAGRRGHIPNPKEKTQSGNKKYLPPSTKGTLE
jgi:hypothetical protein